MIDMPLRITSPSLPFYLKLAAVCALAGSFACNLLHRLQAAEVLVLVALALTIAKIIAQNWKPRVQSRAMK